MEDKIIEVYAKMADDLFINLLLMKELDGLNTFIPFTCAHILELSVKTACFKLGLDNGYIPLIV